MQKSYSEPRGLFQRLCHIDSLTAFYAAASFYFVSEGALSVVVPIYLVQLDLSYGEIGGMFGAFGLGMAVVKILVGRHSDLVGRKSYLVAAFFLSACLKLLFPFTTTPLQFAIILGLDGLSRGLYSTVRAPLITELCTPERRGAAFGWVSGISVVGASVGALGGGLLYSAGGRWLAFPLLGFVLLASTMISLLLIPSVSPSVTSRPIGHSRELIQVPFAIWILCLINLFQNIVTPPIWNMVVPIYLTSSLGMSVAFLGIVYSLDNLLGAVLQVGGGQLADRFDARNLFIGAIVLAGFAAFIQLFTHSLIAFLIPLFVFSGLFSISSPILEKIESETVRQNATGFDFALISFSVSVGTVVGSIVIGQLMNSFGERSGFITLATGYFVMTLISWIGLRRSSRPQRVCSSSEAEHV